MSQTTFITREPVVNKSRAITANRLIAHGPNIGEVVETLNELVDQWPTHHPVFVSLGRLVPTPALMDWAAPANAMIEIPAQALAHPQTQALLPKLQEAGISVCLTWFSSGTALPPGIDWRFVLMDARKHPAPTGSPGLSMAWGLKDVPAFRQAVGAGYDGASGWFFLHGNPPAQELSPGHAQIVRLLNLVRNNGEIRDIEAVLKQDVALSYKLLRYINSAGFGLMCEIQSFRHAVSILGYSNLHKWLSLLLVTASRDPGAPAMMQTAIARGRLMEEIGAGFFDKSERDNLFITGAFSLLHVLLGTSMQALLDEMHLPASVTDALLSDEGDFAPFLRLARHCENFDGSGLIKAAAELHLSAEQINRAQLVALGFADSLQA
ncbi:MAG: regulator [Betaproteobacteria bacterium HGW-Betaproteobacteria-13]|jgi:EAL and modified HD-GYP domain-containing signal transduction protein|uniref:Regulator n=1 Tax=Parazoarcus communis TaxID=41977 RepID=A0A2U8GZJ1_9RHOO|nr:HDOD domain-containing protein [Parazoarcus communis]AWI78740.1 regulator [Parazoarcus communis]PKO81123.1 MAG: regulator [Betaproteobacteria bacterium HGW-Betaproteobacteria-13]